MRPVHRLSIAAVIVIGTLGSQAASAQYYGGDYYDGPPPPPRGGYDYRYQPRRPPPPARAAGLNCDAIQPGMFGPKPFSCPLPGPRPLGARCFCDTPVAPLSGGNTVAGRVVP